MRKNVISQRVQKTWTLDETNLTDQDLQVLEELNFPKTVKQGRCAVCRIKKNKVGGVFGEKHNIAFEDLIYLQMPVSVAKRMIASSTLNEANYDNSTQLRQAKEKLTKVTRTKRFEQYYIDGSGLDQEVQDILSRYSSPKPTPSMKQTVVIEEEEVKEVVQEPKVKGLSNIDKGRAKKLYNEGQSADDIVQALGVDKERVINYLKTL